ncbi:SlyX protein [Verrucomicrobia bacterium IMCC26134]|jgi:SlyX protein|nr:SlyX protein [Verrucomicrobia bacterium IMCC26134]
MPNERIDRLEERLAWFERHVTEQDKAMLDLAKRLDRTQAELRLLRERSAQSENIPGASPAEDRPPHY